MNPRPATKEQLCLFHSGDYVESVQNLSGAEDDEKEEAIAEQFGLSRLLLRYCITHLSQ